MKRIIPLMLLCGGIALFAGALIFHQKSERIKSETDSLRALTAPVSAHNEEMTAKPQSEPIYDPSDLDQTPPGVTPFEGSSVCFMHWGNHLRQYCESGDNAELELVDGGDDQLETMRTLTICLNEMVQHFDAYKKDIRPMDSPALLNQGNRQTLACGMVGSYGDSPVFKDSSIFYLFKEHMESGNISRLENR